MTDIRRRTQSRGPLHATEVNAGGSGGASHLASAAVEGEGDAAVSARAENAVVRRTKDGWRVGGAELSDLTSAMVLADLLSAELTATDGGPGDAETSPAGAKPGPGSGETSKLRATIRQLEHALTARIRVEQAIGVLAERHRIQPRQAFEQLRAAARNRGRRVIDIASDVVASATNPLLQLPDELSRPRSVRQSRRPHGVLGSE